MKPSVIIIGTNHLLQAGEARYTAKQQADFSNLLAKTIEEYRIESVAEEMSDDVLADYGVTQTIAKCIASSRSINHSYIDLTASERIALSIGRLTLHQTAQSSGLSPAQARKFEALADQVRENVWLLRVMRSNTWPVLFICGANHAKRMQNLFDSLGKRSLLEFQDYEPSSAPSDPK